MSANPIGLIVLGVAAVIAAVILMYKKFEWFRTVVRVIANAVKAYIGLWISAIKWVVDKLSWIKDAASAVGDFFSAPATMTVTPVAGGSAAGLFGSAGTAGVYGSPMAALAGGGSTAGRGSTAGPGSVTVNVQVGVGDPVEIGRQLERILRQYAQATGSQVALTVGRQK